MQATDSELASSREVGTRDDTSQSPPRNADSTPASSETPSSSANSDSPRMSAIHTGNRSQSSTNLSTPSPPLSKEGKLSKGNYYDSWAKVSEELVSDEDCQDAEGTEQERKWVADNYTSQSKSLPTSSVPNGSKADDAWIRSMTSAERRWRSEREREKGNDSFKAKDYADAVEAYTLSLRLDPYKASVHSNRAAAYIKLKRWDDAEMDCTSSLSLDTSNWKARMRRAAARLERGGESALRGALIDAEAALDSNPESRELQSLRKRSEKALAELEDRKGMKRVQVTEKDEEAESKEGKGTEEDTAPSKSTYAEPPRNKGDARERRSSRMEPQHSAHAESRQEYVDTADDWQSLKSQANAKYKENRVREAVKLYDSAVQNAPPGSSRASLYANRSAAKLALGNAVGAEEDATRAIEESRIAGFTPVKGYYRRSIARKRMNKPIEALEDIQRVFYQQPSDTTAQALQKELKQQVECSQEAVKEQPPVQPKPQMSEYIPKRQGKMTLKEEENDLKEQHQRAHARAGCQSATQQTHSSSMGDHHQEANGKRKEEQDQSNQEQHSTEDGSTRPKPPGELKDEGNAAFKHGKLEDAEQCFSSCIAACGNDSSNDKGIQEAALTNRVLVRIRLGELEDAISDANSALALNPENSKAAFRKGKALRQLKRDGEALKALKYAQDLAPKNREVGEELRWARHNVTSTEMQSTNITSQKDQQKGQRIAVEKNEAYEDRAQERHTSSQPTSQSGQRENREKEKNGVEVSVQNVSASPATMTAVEEEKERGNALMRTGRIDEAIGAYTRALSELSANSPSELEAPLANRAEANLRLERYQHAKADAEAALKINDSNSKARWRLAKALEALDDIGRAADLAERAAEDLPHNSAVQEEARRLREKVNREWSRPKHVGESAAQRVAAQEPAKPKTQAEFDNATRKLEEEPEQLARYIRKLSAAEYPHVFKQSITGTDVTHIVMALHGGLMERYDDAAGAKEVLEGLVQVPRIGMVALLLPKTKKEQVSEVVQWLEKSGVEGASEIAGQARRTFKI